MNAASSMRFHNLNNIETYTEIVEVRLYKQMHKTALEKYVLVYAGVRSRPFLCVLSMCARTVTVFFKSESENFTVL